MNHRIDLQLILLLVSVLSFGQISTEPQPGKIAGQAVNPEKSTEPGLLFYLSGNKGFTADFTGGGQNKPNFLEGMELIPGGYSGPGFHAEDKQAMSYWAPGNIMAQRGTIAFFWRPGYPAGPSPFPIFRVAFADHSSWDMAWLRIDFNGHGFDAFVTDIGLSRTRVSHYMDSLPGPMEWTHIAFSWDETAGVRLYVNGELAEQISIRGNVYDTGLDQLGPFARNISPYAVHSKYSFQRGGDLDELRIYDRMLTDANLAELAGGRVPREIPSVSRNLNERRWRDEWWIRNGWNLPNAPPDTLPSEHTIIRKLEIHEAMDVKRWMWKANDGIRETTWPGVYNMSRLPGRYDYFVYPDWDCYSVSGQTIRFRLPEEPWNHVEIWGKAWGQLTLEQDKGYDHTFAVRTKDQVKSYHSRENVSVGGVLRYDNALIEEPIGEFGVYHIHQGQIPGGSITETFVPEATPDGSQDEDIKSIIAFIKGRYPADEQTIMVGVKEPGNAGAGKNRVKQHEQRALPVIHMLIPGIAKPGYGLDGVEIGIPGLPVSPTHGAYYPLNIRIKDPNWPMRDLADISFSVRPGDPHTIFLDTRDRLLSENNALFITISGAGYGLTPDALKDARVRLVYKPEKEAGEEHVADRFTQIKDNYAFAVEEHPRDPRLNLYNRFMADYNSLMDADPDHWLARAYMYAVSRNKKDRPDYEIPELPGDMPGWAYYQVEYLRLFEQLANYYIDERQISNGEFGGGLSDDDDFSYFFIGSALMGIHPEKIEKSLKLLLEAYFDQERDPYDAPLKQRSLPLFTNGLATIHTDELHAFEEGIEAVGQMMVFDYGNPLYISRAMETAKRVLEDVTAIAPDGHRHIRSRFYSGTRISTEDPWQWSHSYSYLILQSAYLIASYNGNPDLQKMIVEVADGLLAHRDPQGAFHPDVNFMTGEDRDTANMNIIWNVLYAAYEYTGDDKYLESIPEKTAETRDFNTGMLSEYYKGQIIEKGVNLNMDTEGSIWIDRISNRNDLVLQGHRLGGAAMARVAHLYPLHHASWDIHSPGGYSSLAMFSPEARSEWISMIVYNLEKEPVDATMTAWKTEPGKWRVVKGVDLDADGQMDAGASENILDLVQGDEINFTFPPSAYTIIQMELVEGDGKDYWERPDLAICREFVKVEKDRVVVRVYSQGAVGTPESTLELRDAGGKVIQSAAVPQMEAPLDLVPVWEEVILPLPEGIDADEFAIIVDPEEKIPQVTRRNNRIFINAAK